MQQASQKRNRYGGRDDFLLIALRGLPALLQERCNEQMVVIDPK